MMDMSLPEINQEQLFGCLIVRFIPLVIGSRPTRQQVKLLLLLEQTMLLAWVMFQVALNHISCG